MKLSLTHNSAFMTLTYKPAIDQWTLNKEPIELGSLVIMPASIKTGWVRFTPGAAPDWQWDEAPGKASAPPSGDHKRGFSIEVETAAHGKMEWSGAGYGQCAALEALMEEISASEADHPGKLPVAVYCSSEVRKVGKGSTRIPRFEIVDWLAPGLAHTLIEKHEPVICDDPPF